MKIGLMYIPPLMLDETLSVPNLLGLVFIVAGLAVVSLDTEPGGRAFGS